MTYKEQLKLHEAKIAQHDKEIAAIRKLIRVGMKMLVKNEELLNELIKSLKGASNGHKT